MQFIVFRILTLTSRSLVKCEHLYICEAGSISTLLDSFNMLYCSTLQPSDHLKYKNVKVNKVSFYTFSSLIYEAYHIRTNYCDQILA